MSTPDPPSSAREIYQALFEYFGKGSSEATLVMMIFRLMTEVEALREALSSPETPESVRQSYRQAYERIAVLSHNAAGFTGGMEKVLRRFFPQGTDSERFVPEMAMLERLGATSEELQTVREELETVETYT
jgi:hypothetical protein